MMNEIEQDNDWNDIFKIQTIRDCMAECVCENCASKNIRTIKRRVIDHVNGIMNTKFMCDDCGYEFEVQHNVRPEH